MINEFLAFIDRHNLFNTKHNILLAVSGGIDSMVMLHLFAKAKVNIGVAHVNFGLRGAESDADEKLVEDVAKNFSVPFFSTRVDTKKYATEKKLSTQEAARDLRYNWFEEIMETEGYDVVATAHHLNDSFETVLYNLVKGTGIDGMTGIAPKNENIVRPLLFATHGMIVQWAKENQVKWREDVSNASDDYSRNLIRNRVIPELEKINPSLINTFINSQARLLSTAEILQKQVEKFKADFTRQDRADIVIEKEAVAKADLAVVDQLLKKYGFNIQQVKDILNVLNEEKTGKLFSSTDFQLNIDRDQVIISPLVSFEADNGIIKEEQSVFRNRFFRLELSQDDVEKRQMTKYDAVIDYNKLKFPLIVRKWQEGDTFQPLGMKGKKKLSDFMIDCKIPLNLKERVYVLESAGAIAWVIGYRLDDRFKVNDSTNRVLNFRLTYHD